MNNVPLSEEELEVLFQEIYRYLNGHGTNLDEAEARKVFQRVQSGVRFLGDRYMKWWTVVEDGEIDLRNPAKRPFNLITARFKIHIQRNMIPEDRVLMDNGLIPFSSSSDDEENALNAFWNAFILDLRRNSTFILA